MVKKWQKQLDKLSHKNDIAPIIQDIMLGNLDTYDVVKLTGYLNLYRIRKGKIRIVFRKLSNGNELIAIDSRGQIYKEI